MISRWVELLQYLRKHGGYVLATYRLVGDASRPFYPVEPGGKGVRSQLVSDAISRRFLVPRDGGLFGAGVPQSWELDETLK